MIYDDFIMISLCVSCLLSCFLAFEALRSRFMAFFGCRNGLNGSCRASKRTSVAMGTGDGRSRSNDLRSTVGAAKMSLQTCLL